MLRNRSQGWIYAKKSGHNNETLIAKNINDNLEYYSKYFDFAIKNCGVITGIKETLIPSIFQDKTKSKTDIVLQGKENDFLNISIKKSKGGQVFLVSPERFIKGYEIIFNVSIPDEVKKAIAEFFGNKKILESYNMDINYNADNIKIQKYQLKKQRLVAQNLTDDNADILLNWFKNNIYNITLLCFSTGFASSNLYYSEIIWYKNLVDDKKDLNTKFFIEDIATKSEKYINLIEYGTRNGGTTIQLPFGFLQWHQCSMQFHHDFDKIAKMIS
ncbi:hypothetical protein [Campylobacter coli]|uniref:hypothetical protein n=1 Tax=Campylobacter coli TaxID=195 RepID=UPI0009316B05|nr:hypothetical protein [Campylobacter coli]